MHDSVQCIEGNLSGLLIFCLFVCFLVCSTVEEHFCHSLYFVVFFDERKLCLKPGGICVCNEQFCYQQIWLAMFYLLSVCFIKHILLVSITYFICMLAHHITCTLSLYSVIFRYFQQHNFCLISVLSSAQQKQTNLQLQSLLCS